MKSFEIRGHNFIFKEINDNYENFICKNCNIIVVKSKLYFDRYIYNNHKIISKLVEQDDITCSEIIIKSIIE